MNDQHRRITTHDLSAELLADATDQRFTKGLPTGDNTADGSITYHMTFWHCPYRARSGQVFYIPAMRGYGGNIQLLLPNGMSAFRIGNDTVTKKSPTMRCHSFASRTGFNRFDSQDRIWLYLGLLLVYHARNDDGLRPETSYVA